MNQKLKSAKLKHTIKFWLAEGRRGLSLPEASPCYNTCDPAY